MGPLLKTIRLFAGAATIGLWTLASRVLGLVREIMIAAFLGAGPVAEAFLIAFALPNMFRRFFAEGAFNKAFVPLFAKRLETDDTPLEFARDAFAGLGLLLILLAAVAHIAMPLLVLAMASGFAGDERLDLAVSFGRVTFPYILFISLAALVSGVLNATGRFAAAAAAPILLNVFLISAMAAAHLAGWTVAWALVIVVPVAGLAQLTWVWWAAKRAGYEIRPRLPRWTPHMRQLALLALPAMAAGGVLQINLLIGRQVASQFPGAIAWLGYADRLYQLPLGAVGIAVGTALLPDLSRRLSSGDEDGAAQALARALEMALLLTIPAAVALLLIPGPLVSVLYGRGAFGPESITATASALAIYGLGLPAFVLQQVLQPIFFAREDTKTPFRVAVGSMFVNAAVSIGLAGFIGFEAAAWGTVAASWMVVLALWVIGQRRGIAFVPDTNFFGRAVRILVASAIMGALIWGAAFWAGPLLVQPGLRIMVLLGIVALGIASYFGIGQAIGAFSLGELKRALRRDKR